LTRKVINTRLDLVEYSSVGKGTPILFIHGGHANCQDTLPQKGLDKTKFQLITPSRPGYGKTPLCRHKTPGNAADLLVAFLDALNIQEVIVYAISAGGYTALELVSNYANRANKLLLVSAVTKKWLNAHEITYRLAKFLFNLFFEWAPWGIVHIFSKLTPGLIANNFFPEFSTKPGVIIKKNESIELTHTLQHYRSKEGFANDIRQDINVSVLQNINCPTLILHSKYDASVSIEHAEHAHREIKNAVKVLLENKWGHLIWIGDDYKETLSLILDFMNEKSSISNKL